jgi:hypothetical protein
VSIFSSRMTPEQLAAYKAAPQEANEIAKLAQKANGHGVTRAEREKAQAELVAKVGPREAKRQQDHAIKRHTR